MEGIGAESKNVGSAHSEKFNNMNGKYKHGGVDVPFDGQLHTFSVERRENVLVYYCDDREYFRTTANDNPGSWPFNTSLMKIVLNFAVGG